MAAKQRWREHRSRLPVPPTGANCQVSKLTLGPFRMALVPTECSARGLVRPEQARPILPFFYEYAKPQSGNPDRFTTSVRRLEND
ncbi:hypothetical protein VTN31DRAFT_6308 [Thermomyces dupontii]|uniref:uncharacterized protein n=1 Tax=Talaromyces thermophilus TaxID=28565 RepID=UPI0037440FC0